MSSLKWIVLSLLVFSSSASFASCNLPDSKLQELKNSYRTTGSFETAMKRLKIKLRGEDPYVWLNKKVNTLLPEGKQRVLKAPFDFEVLLQELLADPEYAVFKEWYQSCAMPHRSK